MKRQTFTLLAGFAVITISAAPSFAGERECYKPNNAICPKKAITKPLVRPLTEPLPMRKGDRQRSRRILM